MRSIRTSSSLLALLVAVSYLGLAILGAACLFGESAEGHASHHHAGKVAHSPLCAWACQAGPSVAIIGFGGVSVALYVLFWFVTAPLAFFSQIAWATARPRAPPFASR